MQKHRFFPHKTSFYRGVWKDDIWNAAQFGELHVVRHLLRQDPSLLETRGLTGETPLIAAAGCAKFQHSAAVVQLLLEKQADVGGTDHAGATALHWVAAEGNAEVVQQLVLAGAPLNVKDKDGPEPQGAREGVLFQDSGGVILPHVTLK